MRARTVSLTQYILVLSILIDLIFIGIGAGLIALISIKQLKGLLPLLIIFMLWKGIIIGIVVKIGHSIGSNKDIWVNYLGSYYGRFFGLYIGVVLGDQIAKSLKVDDFIGMIIGGIALYFVGRWVGSKVSNLVVRQVDKVLILSRPEQPEKKI